MTLWNVLGALYVALVVASVSGFLIVWIDEELHERKGRSHR